MNLVGRDRRSPEQSQSYVGEGALLCRAGRPILALHHAVVRGRTPKRDPISVIVGAHPGESAASRHSTFEMEYVRRFQVRPGGLIVAAIFVQPRDRIRVSSAVRSHLVVA